MADMLQNATISPPETGIAASIDRFKNKVRDFLGADHKPAGDIMAGPVLGPLNMAHGVAIAPSHPVRGAHEVISGLGQTVALPSAVINPATMAYAAPAVVAQQGVTSGLKQLGVDDDYANLSGDIAGVVAGGGVHKGFNAKGTIGPPDVPAMAKLAAREVTGRVPLLGRLSQFKKPTISEYMDALTKPTDDDSEGIQPSNDPAPAPYRMSGKQIQGAVTVTPRPVFKPKGLLNAAPSDDATPISPAVIPRTPSSPKAAQTGILKSMGIASPAATVKPMTKIPTAEITPRSDLRFAGANSGDSAAMNQLTENYSPDKLGINDLRGIAQARGIKVSPSDSHSTLIGKIHDSLTPEELDKFEQARIERMQPDYSIPSTITPPQ
jgi:hypothetical protein